MDIPNFNSVLMHGCDYNPDQWLDRPDVLETDMELMKKAGINSVSVGIFAWTALEPEDGVYTFGWLGEVIDRLYQKGIYTVLATPSGARPAWLAQRYPEVLRVAEDMTRNLMGQRHNHCPTSPAYREKVWQMNKRLSESFGSHPGVVLWHLSNEYGGECFCPLCQQAFREWLQSKYGTLEALNKAYWAAFWSHTYTAWEQIEAPVPKGETLVHGLMLDWKRFTTSQTLDFYLHERAAVEAGGSKLPFTTNFMYLTQGLNYYKFKDAVDIVSWDSYPQWHSPGLLPERNAAGTAFTHDVMRSIRKAPFLLMESTPSMVNWTETAKLKRPGMHELASLQAVAHGADSVQYFQWRKSRGSSEKLHGAVVDHYGGEDTRVFREVAALGERLKKLGDVQGTMPRPEVAILFDWENKWAIEQSQGPRNCGMHYLGTLLDHYEGFWQQGVSVDIVDMECELAGYKLVVAPLLYMYRAGIEEKLRTFVEAGGTLVGTYWSGVVDENDLCHLGGTPHGMTDVFGLRMEEIDALYDGEANSFSWQGERYVVRELCERVVPAGAEVLAVYDADFYAGEAVLLRNSFGSGEAYYLAARADRAFCARFYKQLCREKGIAPSLNGAPPTGVTDTVRYGGGKKYVFVQNYTAGRQIVKLRGRYMIAETGREAGALLLVEPYSCCVLVAEEGQG